MIIDDDYCQYDTFRIINKADTDAIAQFKQDSASRLNGKEELEKWQNEAEKWRAVAEESEESVYQLTYAERMVLCWTRTLG